MAGPGRTGLSWAMRTPYGAAWIVPLLATSCSSPAPAKDLGLPDSSLVDATVVDARVVRDFSMTGTWLYEGPCPPQLMNVRCYTTTPSGF